MAEVDQDLRAILDGSARLRENVVFRTFEAETLLLNLSTGTYHGLNATGGRLVELLEETDGSVREATEQLAAEHDLEHEDIAPDMARFCLELEERELMEIARRENG